MVNGEVVDAGTVECENCGEERYTFEACQHCGHKHWED